MKSKNLWVLCAVGACCAQAWDANATTIRWRNWFSAWDGRPGVRFLENSKQCTQESLEMYGRHRLASKAKPANLSPAGGAESESAPSAPVMTDRERMLENLKNFIGGDRVVTSVWELDRAELKRVKTINDVWSDSYWPDQQGGIASPYAHAAFPDSRIDFRTNYRWFHRTRHKKVWPRAQQLSAKELERLSPSEKYDLLVGDTNFTLTKSVWEDIRLRHQHEKCQVAENGHIFEAFYPKTVGMLPNWAGVCNGWALAALKFPRPESKVTAVSPSGQVIPFYPSDLRALASHLGARSTVNSGAGSIFQLGNRCNERGRVKRDIFGQIKDADCADMNAGTFHIATLNKIGLRREGYVLEAKPKKSVFNHPAYGYEMKYFNPVSGREGNLEASLVAAGSFDDMYSDKREKDTRFIVGVEMKVLMLGTIGRRQRETFDRSDDKQYKQTYVYDLELDERYNIIGGKWRLAKSDRKTMNLGIRVAKRPDFIWSLASGYDLIGLNDPIPKFNPSPDLIWDGNGPVPPALREVAHESSIYSMPLNAVIRVLFEKSDVGPKQSTTK